MPPLPQEEMISMRDITNQISHYTERDSEPGIKSKLEALNPKKFEDLFLMEKYKDQKREIISKAKENKVKIPLERIIEAENSEYESSTFDDRIYNSYRVNQGKPSPPQKYNSSRYDYHPVKEVCVKSQPLLYIDVKISKDQVSRLVLYKGQTPVQAATEFINEHSIPSPLRAYLICKVNSHYERYVENRKMLSN